MKPTADYLRTSEISKSRFEANFSSLRAVVENIGLRSSIFISFDDGVSWRLIEWRLSISALIYSKLMGTDWPLSSIVSIESLTQEKLSVMSLESRWEKDVYLYSTYSFSSKKWESKISRGSHIR